MATLGGGEGGFNEVILLYFPKMSIDFINTFIHVLAQTVPNKWEFSWLKCNQIPSALRFTMYIRISRDF
jgi:hypothetical protein